MTYGILVADNNEAERSFYARKLREEYHYDVYEADSPAAARQIFERTRLHLLLLDYRMTDDDAKDRSGVALAHELEGPVPRLIFTGWDFSDGGWDTIGQRIPGKIDFINKRGDIADIFDRIQHTLSEYVAINWKLKVKGISFAELVAQLEPGLDNGRFGFLTSDMEDLFRHLFQHHTQIVLERLPVEVRGCVALRVVAYSARGTPVRYAVVCGPVAQIARARRVFGDLPGGGNLTLRQAGRRRSYGALVYHLYGAEMRDTASLRTTYRSHSALFGEVLQGFAAATLRPWCQQREQARGLAVIEQFCAWLGCELSQFDDASLSQQIDAICDAPAAGAAQLQREPHGLTLWHAGQMPFEALPAAFDLRRLVPGLVALCGDIPATLRPDAVLVDLQSRQSWLLDYGDLSKSVPLLAPFLELETQLKLDMLDHDGADLWDRSQLERRLALATGLELADATDTLPAPARRALEAIGQIRSRAFEIVPDRSMRAYQVGLLLYALREVLAYDASDVTMVHEQHVRASHLLFSAALLFHTLTGATPIRKGLHLDAAQRRAFVNSNELLLPGEAYRLLEYLYGRASTMCSYWDIVCDLYKPSLRDADARNLERYSALADRDAPTPEQFKNDTIAEYKTTIETNLSRVRTQIRLYGGNEQYLVVLPRQGITLHTHQH